MSSSDRPVTSSHQMANHTSAGNSGCGSVVVAVHGGAWDIPEQLWTDSIQGVKAAALAAHKKLLFGGNAVDAVEAAVVLMEEDPVFDAGLGSVLTSEGGVEVSALIMEGARLEAGAVAAASCLLTPVMLARRIMEDTPYSLLAGEGANKFAESIGMKRHSLEELVTDEARRQLGEYTKYRTAVNTLFNKPERGGTMPNFGGHDTVGCVALDAAGLVACATSTGGITGQLPGRVGDTPLVGCGGYADNEAGAVSTTGHGESIIRVGLAHCIVNSLAGGVSAHAAGEAALARMLERVGGRGGCVVVRQNGDVAAPFTTARMPWAYVKEGLLHWGMNPGDHQLQTVADGLKHTTFVSSRDCK